MDATKLKNQLTKYAEYLIVDKGLSRRTVAGYSRPLSIALRRTRKFCPEPREIRKLILWMHEKNYSYAHIVNTSLALEHYATSRASTWSSAGPASRDGLSRTCCPNPKSRA
jgi:site-specific recombinase XerC